MTWLKTLPYILAVAIFAAWTGLAYHLGGEARADAVRLAWHAERTANAKALTTALERTLDAERAMHEDVAARTEQHREEMKRVQDKSDLLQHQLATGARRVSVRARPPACQPTDVAGATAASGPAQAHAELDAAFAAAVAGIAGDGDTAIADLNACIDSYNDVRARINALTGPANAQTP